MPRFSVLCRAAVPAFGLRWSLRSRRRSLSKPLDFPIVQVFLSPNLSAFELFCSSFGMRIAALDACGVAVYRK